MYRLYVIAVVVFIFGTVIVKVVGRVARTSTAPDLDTVLVQTANKMNATLPKMVSEEIRMDTTVAGPGKQFTYFSTLTSQASSEIDAQEFYDDNAPVLTKHVCNLAEAQKLFRKGITFHYVYRGNDGVEVARIAISPEDCRTSH